MTNFLIVSLGNFNGYRLGSSSIYNAYGGQIISRRVIILRELLVMNVDFARPSVSDLVFQAYGRTVHPELFQVHAELQVWQEEYKADIRICDAGHTVDFHRNGQCVTEVTATSTQPLPQRKRFLDRKLRGSRDESFRLENGLKYHVSYQLEQLDPEVYQEIHEELLVDTKTADVSHCFPAGNRLSPGPLSLIRVDVGARSLLIHAFHTFPDALAVVKTQSLFEL
ncbi:MAG: DUF2617 family protein [Planctomycetaceae bacterium]|nr:DUF2617 family protein [Planctomycetaceae bacterium]